MSLSDSESPIGNPESYPLYQIWILGLSLSTPVWFIPLDFWNLHSK